MRSSESRSGTPRGSDTVTIRSNSQKSRVGSAIPCSCARLHMMSVATDPPRWVCSSASPCSNIPRAYRSGAYLRLAARQALVEEPSDQDQRADREERERARDRAQEREVVDEQLREADS